MKQYLCSELLSNCISTILLWISIDKRIQDISIADKFSQNLMIWFTCFVQIENMKVFLFWFALGKQFLFATCTGNVIRLSKKLIEEIINLVYIILYQVRCTKGHLIPKCLFGVFNFLQKTNENKSHSSKIEFLCSFFGGNVGLKESFWFCLTFNKIGEIHLENYVVKKYECPSRIYFNPLFVMAQLWPPNCEILHNWWGLFGSKKISIVSDPKLWSINNSAIIIIIMCSKIHFDVQ